MPLDKRDIETLLASVASTRDDEISCDTCLAAMAEFAETQLLGADLSESLARVEAHIATCPECAEEYGVLLDVLSASTEGSAWEL